MPAPPPAAVEPAAVCIANSLALKLVPVELGVVAPPPPRNLLLPEGVNTVVVGVPAPPSRCDCESKPRGDGRSGAVALLLEKSGVPDPSGLSVVPGVRLRLKNSSSEGAGEWEAPSSAPGLRKLDGNNGD